MVSKSSPVYIEMLAQIDAQFVDFAPMWKVSTPSKSLIDYYEEVMAPAVE